MSKAYVGIDLGTSSVKIICRDSEGKTLKAREEYKEPSPEGWFQAVTDALGKIEFPGDVVIGLSSQVGTYIVNEKDVIGWDSPVGRDEIRKIKERFQKDIFIKEISMPHPEIISYPIPRLKYIQKVYGDGANVCQPKDIIGRMLTGRFKTDKFSWRGLANLSKNKYSDLFLKEVGNPKLPELADCTGFLGWVSDEVSKRTGLPKNTPVYVGLNDFFASILGMGMLTADGMFDITGTSEHLGIITDEINSDTKMVSGPFLLKNVHYGVTASSGASLDFGIRHFGLDGLEITPEFVKESPIFTPYLNGERAPIFDSNASGAFIGIRAKCKKENFAYSVLEGVVFSIYHIFESMECEMKNSITVSGGASENNLLNLLKAEMFGVSVKIMEEKDTSALGGAMVAAVGCGDFKGFADASKEFCRVKKVIEPTGDLREILRNRFKIYKAIYPALKDIY